MRFLNYGNYGTVYSLLWVMQIYIINRSTPTRKMCSAGNLVQVDQDSMLQGYTPCFRPRSPSLTSEQSVCTF